MQQKITFKEYLDSKEKLLKAVTESPIRVATYTVKKYCKIPLGESKEEKEYVALKPKHCIVVEWKYSNPERPEPLSVRFKNIKNILEDDEFSTYWSSEKLQQWLKRNAKEEL